MTTLKKFTPIRYGGNYGGGRESMALLCVFYICVYYALNVNIYNQMFNEHIL